MKVTRRGFLQRIALAVPAISLGGLSVLGSRDPEPPPGDAQADDECRGASKDPPDLEEMTERDEPPDDVPSPYFLDDGWRQKRFTEPVTVWVPSSERIGDCDVIAVVDDDRTIEPAKPAIPANRVKVVYTEIDHGTAPAVIGVRVETPWADDLEAQKKFGVVTEIIYSGANTPEEAIAIRDVTLERNGYLMTEGARRALWAV